MATTRSFTILSNLKFHNLWLLQVTSVDAALLDTLVADGYIPVLATVAADSTGQALNVNADIAAGEV